MPTKDSFSRATKGHILLILNTFLPYESEKTV
jgi:hypothetical protein